MRPYVRALQARKLTATAIDLPRSKAERAVPVFIEKVPAGAIAGGDSYGGRGSSMAGPAGPDAPPIPLRFPLPPPRPPQGLRPPPRPKIEGPGLLLSRETD